MRFATGTCCMPANAAAYLLEMIYLEKEENVNLFVYCMWWPLDKHIGGVQWF